MAGPIGSGVQPRQPVVAPGTPSPSAETEAQVLPPGSKLAPDGKTVLGADGKPLKGPDGQPILLLTPQAIAKLLPQSVAPTASAKAAGGVQAASSAKPAFASDKVEADQSFSLTTLSEKPELPIDDGVPNSNTASDFKAFVGFLEVGVEEIGKPGQLKELWARAVELRNNPSQSALAAEIDSEQGVAIGKAFGDGIDQTAQQIRDGLPPEMREAWDNVVNQVKNSPVGKDPKMAVALIEAMADLAIMICFRMNNSAARQMKSFFADVLSVMSKFDAAKRNQINEYQGQITTKLESGERAQAAAESQKFWNCLLAIGLIIVAIVCLVLSIFTFGAAAAGTAAAVMAAIAVVAAVVMTVCVIIQNLPAILEACGADDAAASMRKALAGPFGKVLLGIMIAAAACMLICGIGGAIAAASTTAVQLPAQGAQVAVSTGSGTVTGTVGASAPVMVNGVAGTATPILQGSTTVATVTTTGTTTTISAVSGTVSAGTSVTNATATGISFGTSATNVFGQTMTATVSASTNTATGVTTLGMSSANVATAGTGVVSGAQAAAGVAGGGMSVARGCIQMSQAELEFATAMLHADIQELQVNMQRLKGELDLNRVFKGDWEESIKGVEQFLNKVFQQSVQAMAAVTEGNQAVANTYR